MPVHVTCSICGASMLVPPSKAERDKHHFCSAACFSRRGTFYRGENNPNWKGGGPRAQCANCGRSFNVDRCNAKVQATNRYCSMRCQRQGARRTSTALCAWCGRTFQRKQSGMKYAKSFCCRSCYESERGATASGPSNEWRIAVRNLYGNRCAVCLSGAPHAHHPLPVRNYRLHRNETWNGVALCNRCHATLHNSKLWRDLNDELRCIAMRGTTGDTPVPNDYIKCIEHWRDRHFQDHSNTRVERRFRESQKLAA